MRFKIDWAGLIVGRKFTGFGLFYFVLEGNFPSTGPRGAYIWRGDLKESFWRYRFGEIIFRGAYFRNFTVLGGVYMRKLAPARVSYRDDFLISYRVYMLTGSFHISYLKVHLHLHMLIKCTSDSKWQTLRMRYPFQSTERPI